MTDEELIRLLQQREESGLEQLRVQYEAYCMHIARKILGSQEDARQVVNDVWLSVWNSIPPASPENLRLYLAKAVRNASLKHIEYHNAQKRSGIHVQLEELAEVIADHRSAPEPDRLALKTAMQAFIRHLSPEHRSIFLRRYWYGDSITQIAQSLGCSQTRVTGILFRLRKQLKKHLEKEGLEP